MKVLKPVGKKNPLTQGYSGKHKAYDHDDLPDKNYYSSFHGVVAQAKNSETKTWHSTGTLTTNDYGNYIKIKAEVDGQTVYQLGAHFQVGTVLPKGTEVKAGQVVAQIGNTGNSTGSHVHTEYRDADNKNFPVEFVDKVTEKPNMQSEEQIIIDVYKALTGEYPSDDEKKWRLQEHKNTVELIEDILFNDSRAKARCLEKWEISQANANWEKTAKQYKTTYDDLKVLLGMGIDDNTEDVYGRVSGMIETIKRLNDQVEPKTVYKIDGRDFEIRKILGNIVLLINK